MRIAFLVWEYPPKIVGGLGTFAQYVCPKIVELGHDISLLTMNDEKGTLKTREILKGVEVHRPLIVPIEDTLPLYITEDLRKWGDRVRFFGDIHAHNVICASKLVNDLIEKEKYDFQIIVANDWLSAEGGIIAERKTGLPFIFHIHSTEEGRTMGNGSNTIIHLERKAIEKADRVITVSFAMQEELIKYGTPLEKISVCWNGIDVERYNPSDVKDEEIQALRQRYAIGPEDKMILFVGRAVPIKGIWELVMAMEMVIKKHPRAKLVMLTSGPPEIKMALGNLVERLGLQKHVIIRYEFVSEEERILHYAACDLAVFPSHYEPFGIVSLEAMAMAKPVVVGACGICGFKEQVISSGQEQTGFHVDGKNPADIAQWGIIPALDDPEAAKKMGERGRKRVKEDFTWDQVVRSLLKVYEDVILTKK